MEEITSSEQLHELMRRSAAGLFYFSTPDCGVCKTLRPKVEDLARREFPRLALYYVDCARLPEAAAQHSVLAVPTVVLVFEGQETWRLSRSFGLDELRAAVERPYYILFEGP